MQLLKNKNGDGGDGGFPTHHLPGKLGCRLRVEEKGLILRSGNLSEGTGKGRVCYGYQMLPL